MKECEALLVLQAAGNLNTVFIAISYDKKYI